MNYTAPMKTMGANTIGDIAMLIKIQGDLSELKRETIRKRAQKILDSDSRIVGLREFIIFGTKYLIQWAPNKPTIVYPHLS